MNKQLDFGNGNPIIKCKSIINYILSCYETSLNAARYVIQVTDYTRIFTSKTYNSIGFRFLTQNEIVYLFCKLKELVL